MECLRREATPFLLLPEVVCSIRSFGLPTCVLAVLFAMPLFQPVREGGDRHRRRPIRELSLPEKVERRERKIRVGWVSRFLYKHPVGLLCEGIIEKLPRDK